MFTAASFKPASFAPASWSGLSTAGAWHPPALFDPYQEGHARGRLPAVFVQPPRATAHGASNVTIRAGLPRFSSHAPRALAQGGARVRVSLPQSRTSAPTATARGQHDDAELIALLLAI
jgi:hypothetical protein